MPTLKDVLSSMPPEAIGFPFKVDVRASGGSGDAAYLEAWTATREHAERLASSLFREYPKMHVSISPSDGDPVEYLTSGASAIPVVRAAMPN